MNTMAQYNKTKEEILTWFDWAQPLIELGLATQQAQEVVDWKSIPEVIQPDEIKLFRENPDRDW
jgi:hypothetical protein